jgi:transposase
LDDEIAFQFLGSSTMDVRSSLSEQQRCAAVALFATGYGRRAVARQLGVSDDAIRALHDRWRLHGEDALVTQPPRPAYAFELKREVVERFLAGESKMALAQAFDLSSPKLIATWARIYRREGEDGLRPKPRGRPRRASDAPDPDLSEVEQLRRENERLRAEVAYLGKLRALMAPKRR